MGIFPILTVAILLIKNINILLNSHETNNVIKTLPKFLILIEYCYYFNVELTLKQGLVNNTLIELIWLINVKHLMKGKH